MITCSWIPFPCHLLVLESLLILAPALLLFSVLIDWSPLTVDLARRLGTEWVLMAGKRTWRSKKRRERTTRASRNTQKNYGKICCCKNKFYIRFPLHKLLGHWRTPVHDIWRAEGWGTIVGEIRGKGRNSAKGGGCKLTGGWGSVNGTLNLKLTLLFPSLSLTQLLHRSVQYQIKLKMLSWQVQTKNCNHFSRTTY